MTAVCLSANTLYYPRGGGHRWVYLNWALGLRAAGCEVTWLETVDAATPQADTGRLAAVLREQLVPYGLGDRVALCRGDGTALPGDWHGLEAAAAADVLVNLRYDLSASVLARFGRTVLVDIDPGLLQVWMHAGSVRVAAHDLYVTTSEAVARGGGAIPDVGVAWHHAPPCVALEWWPVGNAPLDAAFSTVSHWGTYDEWVIEPGGASYSNDKQVGFAPFLDLPARVGVPLELALCLASSQAADRDDLRRRGWRVADGTVVASSPVAYQRYIAAALGEFSAVKPSCVRLANAWVSDRSLCYLASGKPVVVEHTGPSALLPDAEGLFRVRDVSEAAGALRAAVADYDRHAKAARMLAEAHFDARAVAGAVLQRALA